MSWKWPKLTLKDEPSPMQNVAFRRQKQFNWDALRGWALGLFKGLTDYSDSLDAKMTDFDNRFDDQMSAATDGDKDLSEVVDARRPDGGSAYATLGKRLDAYEPVLRWYNNPGTNSWSDIAWDIDGGIKPYFMTALNDIRQRLTQGLFTIVYGTDHHYETDSDYAPFYNDGLRHELNMLSLSDISDVILFGGDQCDQGIQTKDHVYKQEDDFATTALTYSNTDTFLLKGNHDSGYHLPQQMLTPDNVLIDTDFANLYHYGTFSETRRVPSANYFYKDYNDVRLIGLDSYDLPMTTDNNGELLFNRFTTSGYSQDQLNWLANEALQTDKQCIIFAHNPINGIFGSFDNSAYLGSAVLQQILEAFVAGQTGTATSSDSIPLNVEYSFTKAGTLIGFFNGHLHTDRLATVNNINYVSTVCSFTGLDNDEQDARRADYGTDKEDAFDVIQIDTVNRNVSLHRFGAGKDRSFTY